MWVARCDWILSCIFMSYWANIAQVNTCNVNILFSTFQHIATILAATINLTSTITYFVASLESSNRSPTPRLVNYFITSSINKRILLLLVVCTLHPMSQACVFIMLCIEDNSQELWWLVRWILWLCVVLISPSRRVSTNVHTLFSRGEFLQQSRNPRHQKELHTKWYVYSIPYVKIGLRVDDKQNTI